MGGILDRFGGSGAVCGSASLASARTLARTVELWGDRPDVWSEGLEQRPRRESVWEGSGPGSASLACPRTLARCVQMCGSGCFKTIRGKEKNLHF